MSTTEGPRISSTAQRSRIVLRLAELGAPEADDQRHVIAVRTDGRARRRSELTAADAHRLIDWLDGATVGDLVAVLVTEAPPAPEDSEPPAEDAPAEPEELAEEHAAQNAAAAHEASGGQYGTPAPANVLEPVPEDVEAAAQAAVERFRARQAADILPEPPALGAIPSRVPVPYTAPGRYCLVRCYCGTCPQYAAQKEAAERVYRQELAAARNVDLR